MLTDSSVITEAKVSKLLIDNDLQDAVVNGSERAMHAFPVIDVLAALSGRINALDQQVDDLIQIVESLSKKKGRK